MSVMCLSSLALCASQWYLEAEPWLHVYESGKHGYPLLLARFLRSGLPQSRRGFAGEERVKSDDLQLELAGANVYGNVSVSERGNEYGRENVSENATRIVSGHGCNCRSKPRGG